MRSNRLIEYQNETLTMAQWARRLDVKYAKLRHRFRKGDDVETAFRRAVGGKACVPGTMLKKGR